MAAIAGEVKDNGDVVGSGIAEVAGTGVFVDEMDVASHHREPAMEAVGAGAGGFTGENPDGAGVSDGSGESFDFPLGDGVLDCCEGEFKGRSGLLILVSDALAWTGELLG